ncbi:hypothetical protein D3C80_2223550 [compost metagenome]
MSIIWRIALSRQSTGSSLPSRACWVRLCVKRSSIDSPLVAGAVLSEVCCDRVKSRRRSAFRRASSGW